MDQLCESIRAAIAPEATPETRAAGTAACRTILAALETVTDAPTAASPSTDSPVASIVGMLRGASPDQLLDLAILKLRSALPAGVAAPRVEPLKFHIVNIPLRG